MRRTLILVVLLCSFGLAAQEAAPVAPSRLTGLDEFVEQLRAQWNLPGMAVGIIQDGKIVFAKGYGYRDVERKLPVTTKTLFAIGSTSKSFTSLSLAILKDQGKIDWDKPIRHYLPTFQVQDPVASARLTLRDLLAHRSGLARHDLVWYSANFSSKDIFDRLRYLEMARDYRSAYEYNNLMYAVAGYLAGEVSGLGWEKLVQQSILDPLGMASTNFHVVDSEKAPDHALPYDEEKGIIKRIPFKALGGIGPAGGINSNLDDMLRYALMLLNKGKYGDRRLVSEAGLKQIQTPQTAMGTPMPFSELGYPSYGMGWVIHSYRGHLYVWHNGGINGFYTMLGLLPNDNVGLVILSNRLGHPASDILTYNIFDRLLGLDQVPWNQRYKELEAKQKQAEKDKQKDAAAVRKPGTHPSHELKDYAGKYENAGYGTLAITFADGKLKATLNELSVPLEHYRYDVFVVPAEGGDGDGFGEVKLSFFTNLEGEIESVAAPLQPGVSDIVFKRVVDKPEKAKSAAAN